MPTTVQFRRGTTAQNNAFTGSAGELSVDTDKVTLRVHDGSTAGGGELVTATMTATLTNKTLTSPTINTGTLDDAVLTGTVTANGGVGSTGQYLESTGSGVRWTSISGYADSDVDAHLSGGTGVTYSSGTISIGQAVATSSDVRFDSFGVGTAASGVTGEIRATNNITAYYSDERLKENIELIPEAVSKVKRLRGVTYNANSVAESYGYRTDEDHVGVIAQDVKEVLPEAVKPAPFDRILIEGTEISKSGQDYMTVQYEKIVPLLIEAIKEQQDQIDALKEKLGE